MECLDNIMLDMAYYSLSENECISMRHIDATNIMYFYSKHVPDASCVNGCPTVHEKREYMHPSGMLMPLTNEHTVGLEEGSITEYMLDGAFDDPNAKKIYFSDLMKDMGFFRKPYVHMESKVIDTIELWVQDGPHEWRHCNKWAGGCGYSSNPAFWSEDFRTQRGLQKGFLVVSQEESFDAIKNRILSVIHNE